MGVKTEKNTFAAARCDNTAMRPFARLLWTLVQIVMMKWRFSLANI